MQPAHCPFCMGEPDTRWTPGDVWRHACGMEVSARFVWFPGQPDPLLAEYFAQFAAAPAEPKQLELWED